MIQPKHILISRTDSIGDVILTLPMAKMIKASFPECKVSFLGKAYTKAVIETCAYIDAFIDLDHFLNLPFSGELPDAIIHVFPVKAIAVRAKQLGIARRIGATGRLYHWHTCNRLVKLSRKNSDLHEAQLNMILLGPFGIRRPFSLEELGGSFGFTNIAPLPPALAALIDAQKFNVILHPKSQGSAREWGLDNFVALIKILPQDQFKIFISGTAKERESLEPLIREAGHLATEICGQMDLQTFIAFINACNGLVANSTGPLHIAAALGKRAVGIFPPIRPMHPGRWQPLGPEARYVVQEKACNLCRKDPTACSCMRELTPQMIAQKLII